MKRDLPEAQKDDRLPKKIDAPEFAGPGEVATVFPSYGYFIRKEIWDPSASKGGPFGVRSYYTLDLGLWLGILRHRNRLPFPVRWIRQFGLVRFRKVRSEHCTPSVAFWPEKDAWVGFSHRAGQSFGIGDKLFDPEWRPEGATDEDMEEMPFKECGGKTIETLAEARLAAERFAEYVS